MPPRLNQDPESLAEFFGLLVECPLHGGNPTHCELRHLRGLHLQDRFEWSKALLVEEAAAIRARCARCMHDGAPG